MSSPDQSLFKGLKALYTADGTLSTLCGPGGFVRAEDDYRSTTAVPRIECSFSPLSDMGLAQAERCFSISALLVVFADRGSAFGTGNTPENAGTMDSIVDRLFTVYDNVRPTVSGWEPSKIDCSAVVVPSPAGKDVRRGVRLSLTMEAA